LDLERADRELDQQWGMAREDPDVAVDAMGDHLARRADPDLALGSDDVDLERH
jgi:hypothetical protein